MRPFTTNVPRLIITVLVPTDEPITDVRLPTNENVKRFSVTVERPSGDEVPVQGGRVSGAVFCELSTEKKRRLPLVGSIV